MGDLMTFKGFVAAAGAIAVGGIALLGAPAVSGATPRVEDIRIGTLSGYLRVATIGGFRYAGTVTSSGVNEIGRVIVKPADDLTMMLSSAPVNDQFPLDLACEQDVTLSRGALDISRADSSINITPYFFIEGQLKVLHTSWTWLGTRQATYSLTCSQDTNATIPLDITVLPAATDNLLSGISINDGDYAVNGTRVHLNLSWKDSDYIDQVMVSNDGGFAASKRQIVDLTGDTISWTLDSQASERISRTVYLRFHDVIKNEWSASVTDDIILDTVAPVVASASIAESKSAKAKGSILKLSASDNRTGVTSVQVAPTKTSKARTTVAYAAKIKLKVAASKAQVVRVQDGAGNWSPWRKTT